MDPIDRRHRRSPRRAHNRPSSIVNHTNMSSSNSDDSLSSGSHKRRPRKQDRKTKRHRIHHAAPSDYAQLRQHFQFVLPDTNDGDNGQKYGSTWQQRMVQHYHSHLYKEYVLADLSRVRSGKGGRGGPVGLRWRTAQEVKDGKGFRSCGNLACCQHNKKIDADYTRKVRSALGIGVAESGGSVPVGVLLSDEESNAMIERYLQSCEREEEKKKRRGRKRKHSRITESKKDDHISSRREAKEQKRLSRLTHGLGLHDYEVDFAYVEQNQKKRELVKVRLCLRCAPLIFDGWAVKARTAREKAAGEARNGLAEAEAVDLERGNIVQRPNDTQEDSNSGSDDHSFSSSDDSATGSYSRAASKKIKST